MENKLLIRFGFIVMLVSVIEASDGVVLNKETKMEQIQTTRSGGEANKANVGEDANGANNRKNIEYYTDEVIYNYILREESNSQKNEKLVRAGAVAPLAYNNFEDGLKREKEEKKRQEEIAKAKKDGGVKKPPYIFTGGYCRLLAPLEVETLSQYASFSCDLEGSSEKVRLTALIQPEHISKALIGRPLYIKTIEGKRYRVKNGVIMNSTQTSINLASVVNDYAIERLIAQGGMESSRIISNYAKQYLMAKRQSETTQQVYYGDQNRSILGIGSQPVVTTNYQKPKKRDYVNMAGVELVSKMVDLLGKAWLDKLDFLYKMKADTVYYVDMQIETKEGMSGVEYNLDNLVHPSPRGLGVSNFTNNSSPSVRVKDDGIDHFQQIQQIRKKKVENLKNN